MKLISWNVNGIRACIKKGFADVVDELVPDVFAVQEIKVDDDARNKADLDFRGYEEYFNPAQKKGYSGTGLLTKRRVEVKNGIGVEEFDHEGRVQTADLGDFYFVNAYFPNSQHDLKRLKFKERFNQEILQYLKNLEKIKPIIITGDFNVARQEIDLARPRENIGNAGFTKEERAWADKFLAADLVDSFRLLHPDKQQYSWWSYRAGARRKNVGWRIDYFLVSKVLVPRITKAYILDDIYGSDHAPIGLELN